MNGRDWLRKALKVRTHRLTGRVGRRGAPWFDPQGPTTLELTRQALSSVEQGYDLLAPRFDVTPFRTPDDLLEQVAPLISAPGGLRSALDVCCGTGAGAQRLRALCRERVIGVDSSQGMLDIAAERCANAPGEAEFVWLRRNALHMGLESEVDVAVSFGAFGHLLPHEEEPFLRAIHTALRPGGRFVFVTHMLPPVWSKRRWMAHGFNAVMRARNTILKPPFVMYYLTFLWPDIGETLGRVGFDVRAQRDAFEAPYEDVVFVEATRIEPPAP